MPDLDDSLARALDLGDLQDWTGMAELLKETLEAHPRERVAVLCDQLGPIWVIGHRIDDRVKLTGLTRRVLHLRAKPLERQPQR